MTILKHVLEYWFIAGAMILMIIGIIYVQATVSFRRRKRPRVRPVQPVLAVYNGRGARNDAR